jgi:hypothetical protein
MADNLELWAMIFYQFGNAMSVPLLIAFIATQ